MSAKTVKRLFKVGKSSRYGSLVATPEAGNLPNQKEEDFYVMLNNSIKIMALNHNDIKTVKAIRNLKRGVTIGCDYYLIVDKR